MNEYDLDFGDETDLAPKRLRVRIGGRDHVLREATGDAAAKYRNACMKATRMDDGKIVGMDGLADAEALLISLCVFSVDQMPEGPLERAVPVGIVRTWPNRITRPLYDKIKDISALDESDSEEALTREIAKLQGRLDKLRKKGPAPKGASGAGPDGSDCAPS